MNVGDMHLSREATTPNRYQFQDRFIQDGKKGGHDAAQALIYAVQEHIKEIDPKASPIINCNIRVYSNVHGLTKVYRETGIIRSDSDLSAFIRGFNMENPLCDFVDAGNGKECADVKIKGYPIWSPSSRSTNQHGWG